MESDISHMYWSLSMDKRTGLDWKGFSQALLNASPSGIAVVDLNAKVVISNSLTQKWLGLFPGTLLTTTIPELSQLLENMKDSGSISVDVDLKFKDSVYSTTLNSIILKNKPLGVLCVFQDMTALDAMTTRMNSYQELSMELDTIIESSNDGLWICDGDGDILRINPASERLTNVKTSEILGRNMQDLIDDGIIDKSVTLMVLESKTKTSIIQNTKSGKRLFLTGTPVFDLKGRLIRVVVNERDITEIEKLQADLEEQEALNYEYKRDILEMQIEEAESENIVAKSSNYQKILHKAIKLGRVDSTVLILGESGTGKGVIADLIHRYSSRADYPMIKLNCGAIPESLVESELFGYDKGAFTGAGKSGKPGKFEMAHKGIIFLDEIADLPMGSQVKLLRFLEDGNLTRVGGTKGKKIDVRVIAATNQNLKELISMNRFRSDLYYRLNVVPLTIPLLRERKECILPLLNRYIHRFSKKYEKNKKIILTSEVVDVLLSYTYPGNVRELVNICERLVVMSSSGKISYTDLPASVIASQGMEKSDMDMWEKSMTLKEMTDQFEKRMIQKAMKKFGTQAAAAAALGLNQSTVGRKLIKYGLQ